MNSADLELIRPSRAFGPEFRGLVREYRAVGEVYDRLLEPLLDDFPRYLRRLEDFARGVAIPRGFVPQTTFWLVRDGVRIVAMGRLRHRLNDALRNEGGHIGYTVRPTQRKKGYGTVLCRLILEQAELLLGLNKVLITCDTDNKPSARIIEKNGGRYAGETISAYSGKPVSRYWIDLKALPAPDLASPETA